MTVCLFHQEEKSIERSKVLNDERKQYLLQKYNEDLRATVNEEMEGLTSQFGGLKIAKTAIHNFTVNECALTIKKACFEPKQINSPASIKASFN